MNKLCVFIMIAFSLCAQAQADKIKIAKQTACDYKLIADPALSVMKVRLAVFSFDGVTKKEVDKIRADLRFVREKILVVKQDSIVADIAKICETKHSKLKSIVVKLMDNKPTIDYLGNAFYHVSVQFNYEKKEKKK